MADPCGSEVLLMTVVHTPFSYGVAVAVSYELSVQDVVVRGEGTVGPACRAIVGKDLTAVVSFLVKPPQESNTGPANLVITTYMGTGATRTHTLASMVTRGFAYEFNRESPPAMYRQSFVHVGPMSDGVTPAHAGEVADMANVTIA